MSPLKTGHGLKPKGLIYEFASKSRSKKIHQFIYGWRVGSAFRPCDLDTTFRFECKMSGNCCRGRALESNVVYGTQTEAIRTYCAENNIPIKGLEGKTLWLDGLDPKQRQTRVTDIRVSGHKGIAYVGPHGMDCQFLRGNLCGVHPVKPILCATAPIGFVLEHLEHGGCIHMALQESKKQECSECFLGPERVVWEWIAGKITNTTINDERERCGWPRFGEG